MPRCREAVEGMTKEVRTEREDVSDLSGGAPRAAGAFSEYGNSALAYLRSGAAAGKNRRFRIGQTAADQATHIAAGLCVAGDSLTRFANSLDWNTIDPTPYLSAGARGVNRGLDEARLVWESIPAQLRLLRQDEVEERLSGFDWSHMVLHSAEGGNEAGNGIFGIAALDRGRGAERLTAAEIAEAASVLQDTAFVAALEDVASKLVFGAALGAAVSGVVRGLEFGLEYHRGEITREEMIRMLIREAVKSAAISAAIAGVMHAVALAFPALIPVAAPMLWLLAALGLCVVGCRMAHLAKEWHALHRGSGSGRSRVPAGRRKITKPAPA